MRLWDYSGHECDSSDSLHTHTEHRCLNSLIHNKGITFKRQVRPGLFFLIQSHCVLLPWYLHELNSEPSEFAQHMLLEQLVLQRYL